MGEDDPYFNGWRIVPVPAGCSLRRVFAAITAVMRRHATLRTVFHHAEGRLWQVVRGPGTVTVEVHQVPAQGTTSSAAADALAAEMVRRVLPMDDWPVSLAVLADGREPRFVVLAFSHMALDHGAGIRVASDLEDHLASRSLTDGHRDPMAQSAWEQSAAGRATTMAALTYWARTLAAGPVSNFDYEVRPPAEPRFRRLVMDSPAVTVAARAAAARLRITTSAVLLAAEATVLALYTGHTAAFIQPVSANRDDPGRKDLVGTLTWDGLALVPASGVTFGQLARKAFQVGISAYRFGYYDPEACWRLRAEQQFLRGAILDLGAHFNDIRDEPAGSARMSQEEPLTPLLPQPASAVVDAGGWPRVDARYFFAVSMRGSATRLSLLCDTCYVPIVDMRQHLLGIERLVIAAASDDVSAERIADITGVIPVTRGASWARCADGGWVDVPAVQRLWQEVTGDARCAVFSEPTAGPASSGPASAADLGCRVTGYCAAPEGVSVAGLHAELVAALGERTDVRAPDWYVSCLGTPDDTASLAAWQRMPVREAASGREAGARCIASTDPADRAKADHSPMATGVFR